MKYDVNQLYTSEIKKFSELSLQETPLSTTGNLSFTSTSSGEIYNSTTGQLGLFQALQPIVLPYMITASEFNAKADTTSLTSHSSDNINAHNIQQQTIGSRIYAYKNIGGSL